MEKIENTKRSKGKNRSQKEHFEKTANDTIYFL